MDGVSIGEYICSGYVYGANVGWINMGNGAPTNHIQYSNASATDFGINYSIDPMLPGKAILRGYAYGANIGWINFESTGNPRLRFSDGRLEGYAYSANCGWINLGDGSFAVQTDTIAPGIDTDSDGMADAFEFLYLGGLGALPNLDSDGDGMTNVQEYLEGTNPTLAERSSADHALFDQSRRHEFSHHLEQHAGTALSDRSQSQCRSESLKLDERPHLRSDHARRWHDDLAQRHLHAGIEAVLPGAIHPAADSIGRGFLPAAAEPLKSRRGRRS